jgi:DNA-binding transcriptional ArsR family regulator
MLQPDQRAFTADRRRMAGRVAGYYFLRTVTLLTRVIDEDLVTALVFLGVTRANVRPLQADPAADAAYASQAEVPPEDLRKPVSVYAVARDLRMPYETVRRHITKLREAGLIEAGARGVWVPNRVHTSDLMREAVIQNWEVSRRFLRDAISVGVIPACGHAAAATDVSRRTVRLSISYFLDSLALMARAVDLDPLSIMIGLEVARGNIEYFAKDRATAEAYAGLGAIPPDEIRRPVSVYAVAKSLGLPYETARRHARRLTQAGWLERKDDGGLILPASVLGRPGVLQAALELAAMTEHYLVSLASIGVPPASEGLVPRQGQA